MGIQFLSPSQLNPIGLKAGGGASTLVQGGQNLLWSSTQGQRLIGAGRFVWDGLQNLNCERNGTIDTGVSVRFRAITSGPMERVQIWIQQGAGYSRGNGGTVRIRVYPDNGTGLPDMSVTPFATATHVVTNMGGGVFSTGVGADMFPIITMTSATPLVAGNLYHAVFDNTAADPVTNSFNLDCTMSWTAITQLSPHRWFNPLDWAALQGDKPSTGSTWSWTDVTIGTVRGTNPADGAKSLPLVMIRINSVWQGMISISSSNPGFPDSDNGITNTWLFGSSKSIRQRFTPTVNTTIIGASFLSMCEAAGNLLVEFKQGASILTSTTVTSTVNAYTGNSPFSGQKVHRLRWYDVQFPSQVTMTAGTTYDLQLTPQGSAQFRFQEQRNLRDYGAAWFDQTCPNYGEYLFSGPSTWYGLNGYLMSDNNGQNGTWILVLHKA